MKGEFVAVKKGTSIIFNYRVPIHQDCSLHEILGWIKKTNDGRWKWCRGISISHRKNWDGNNQQGVCSYYEEAIDMIKAGWIQTNNNQEKENVA